MNGPIEMPVGQAAEMLDGVLSVLEEMRRLAKRSTEDDCSDAERVLLQRDLDYCRDLLDHMAEKYQNK